MKHKSKYILIKIISIGFFLLLISTNISFGQSKIEKLDELLNLYTEYGQFNGSVLVVEKSEILYKKGFGLANMEWNIPNQPNTKHRLGSITKQFTSMLIMQLVQQGKLNLNDPISTYIPNYPKVSGSIITIHHLLTHSSGTPNYTSFPGFFKDVSRDPYTPEEFIKNFADSTLQFNPGERYSYSNSGYFLLGVIIEKVTGESYEQVLKKYITDPLKMYNTGYDHHGTILANRATGYEKRGSNYINAPYLDMSIPYAAGSLYSTVEDLYLWDQSLYTNQLLSKENMDLLFTKHIQTGRGHYGYGWGMGMRPIGNTSESIEVISHGGGINGFNTLITRIPSDKNMIVLFNNTGGAALNQINTAILGILYDESYEMPKKSLANSLFDIINESGLAKGFEHFKKFENSKIYSLKEREMNNVGYQLFRSDKIKEAIEVFKLNVASFPESGNAYDSLGEAYLKDGNKKLAIKNYKKAIELDPNNENGIEILKNLQSEN